jgi:hypothetical protein
MLADCCCSVRLDHENGFSKREVRAAKSNRANISEQNDIGAKVDLKFEPEP